MKVTYYLEVLSSWCYWAEPMWAELKLRYAGRAEFTWKIAQMKASDYPVSRAQCDCFYRRSGMMMRAPFMLSSGWIEPIAEGAFVAPNLVAEASRDFGFEGDEIRLALSHAGEREGRKILQMPVAVAIAAQAGGRKLAARKLQARAKSPEIRARVEASTAEFFAHQVSQRPTFILEDAIGDKAVFSGLVRIEPIAAAIDAMLADTAAYAAHRAHFGTPPAN
ncbi:MAG: disulfide bond formation protein DsbA [Opitutus sp.]|nr:disulfide bond formation protein DsbA [Opitutus sp.]